MANVSKYDSLALDASIAFGFEHGIPCDLAWSRNEEMFTTLAASRVVGATLAQPSYSRVAVPHTTYPRVCVFVLGRVGHSLAEIAQTGRPRNVPYFQRSKTKLNRLSM